MRRDVQHQTRLVTFFAHLLVALLVLVFPDVSLASLGAAPVAGAGVVLRGDDEGGPAPLDLVVADGADEEAEEAEDSAESDEVDGGGLGGAVPNGPPLWWVIPDVRPLPQWTVDVDATGPPVADVLGAATAEHQPHSARAPPGSTNRRP